METKTSIRHRIASQREALLAQLKETPIVEIACKKVGIGRATYYRWKKEDSPFAKATDEAQSEGNKLINDMAESQLLSAIRDKNLGAIVFWLKHHHPTYATKVEVTARLKTDEKLNPEQEALIDKALKLAALVPTIATAKNTEEKNA